MKGRQLLGCVILNMSDVVSELGDEVQMVNLSWEVMVRIRCEGIGERFVICEWNTLPSTM